MSGDGLHTEAAPDAASGTSRRRLLGTAALATALAGPGAGALAGPARAASPSRPARLLQPVPTTDADWSDVADALGRTGNMMRPDMRRQTVGYHTAFPRGDLHVVSHGVTITPGLALGSHVAFVRYDDGSTLAMGDMVAAEDELQPMLDALHAHGIAQTAIHKHLLAHSPDIWWTHVHIHGRDAVAMARGVRAAVDATGTPAAPPAEPVEPAHALDTDAIDAALGTEGSWYEGVYKVIFRRRETITDDGRVLPPGLGATTALIFQPLGGGRAALAGDFVMVADEVDDVLRILRGNGIDLVVLHNHGLRDEPRLFFTHLWATGNAPALARALRPAVDATNVEPPQPA